MPTARILFLADSHLGIDKPMRPRVKRRWRGDDFARNFELALQPAMRGEVDLVVHGGDVLYRSDVPPGLVQEAFAPLKRVADGDVPVYVIPGNHERSAIPYPMLATHPGIHIFHKPRTFRFEIDGMVLALSGFPYIAEGVRDHFGERLAATGWRKKKADARLLCIHESVEGATVGPSDYVFRKRPDVLPGRAIPRGFALVLAGHIHRHQVLTHDLAGRPMAAPVLYPGSIERTSFAEKDEHKGFMMLGVGIGSDGSVLRSWRFVPLPTRPMIDVDLDPGDRDREALERHLRAKLARLPEDAIVRLKVVAPPTGDAAEVLRAANLRMLSPTMSINIRR